jgi:hypothetical protein
MAWKLLDEDGDEISIGDWYMVPNGDVMTITGLGIPPHKPSSTGRVELDGRLYFPTVINAKWIEHEDCHK